MPVAPLTPAPAPHDYVPAGRLLVSAEQRPATLARLLLARGRSLIGVREGAGPPLSRRVREVTRAVGIAGAVASTPPAQTVTLPAAGDVAVPVALGYKVFDLSRGLVVTVLPETTEEEMRHVAEALTRTAACPLAPAIYSVDVPRRTYVEEFIDGRRLRGLDQHLRRLPPYLALLSQVAAALPPRTTRIGDYAAGHAENARRWLERLASSADRPEASGCRATIEEFLDSVLARLATYADLPVQLVLSHGDLHGGNVALSRTGPRVIDWTLSGVRTPSYDLYHQLFRTAARRGQLTLPANRIAAALDAYTDRIDADRIDADTTALDVPGWRRDRDAYRLLFYLECFGPKWPGEPSGRAVEWLARKAAYVPRFRALDAQSA